MEEVEWFGVPWPELNSGIFYKDVVFKSLPDCTLLEYYCSMYEDSAPKLGWIQRIRNGQITVNSAVVTKPDYKISAGARLVYHRLPWREPPAPFKLQILYEDEDIFAVNKPSGLQVLPGGLFQQRTVLSQLQWRLSGKDHEYLAQEENNPRLSSLQPSPVHRLGRGTSGVLLCAKSQIARAKLASDFTIDSISKFSSSYATRHITKKYLALVTGIITHDEVSIKQPIGKVPYPGVSKGLYAASSAGKPSQSNVRVLRRNADNNSTLIEVEILTGRPHQIRIHLAYFGHPLLGDPLYEAGGQPKEIAWKQYDRENIAHDGGFEKPINALPGDCGYHLHAYEMQFHHPITNKVMTITAKPAPPLCVDVVRST